MLPVYVHAYVYIYVCIYIYIYIYTITHNIHIHIHRHRHLPSYLPVTYIHTYIHTYIRAYVHMCIRECVHTCIGSYIHAYIPTYIRILHAHAYVHAYSVSVCVRGRACGPHANTDVQCLLCRFGCFFAVRPCHNSSRRSLDACKCVLYVSFETWLLNTEVAESRHIQEGKCEGKSIPSRETIRNRRS